MPRSPRVYVRTCVRWVDVERPLSIAEFRSECKTSQHPGEFGFPTYVRPNQSGTMEECVLVRAPGEARLEISTEDSVDTDEMILLGADNLEETHADDIADMLKRKLLRKFASKAPTLPELRQRVSAAGQHSAGRASEPACGSHPAAVRVGGSAALRSRLVEPVEAQAQTAPAAKRPARGGASQPAKRSKQPAVAPKPADLVEGRPAAPPSSSPKAPSLAEILLGTCPQKYNGLSAATLLYHYKLRAERMVQTAPRSWMLETETLIAAKQAASRLVGQLRDMDEKTLSADYEQVLTYAVGRHEEDPLPADLFRRILDRRVHLGGASQPVGAMDPSKDGGAAGGGASLPAAVINAADFLDPTPPPRASPQEMGHSGLPETLSQVPAAFLVLEERLSIAKTLLGEVLWQAMSQDASGAPHILAMRSALLPKLSALVPSCNDAGKLAAKAMASALLAVTAPIQQEPMTEDQMRVLARCTMEGERDELEKVIGAKMSKGWWKEQKSAAMQRSVGDVQQGPRLLASARQLGSAVPNVEEVADMWKELMGDRGLEHWLATVRPSACALVFTAACEHLKKRLATLEASEPCGAVPRSPSPDDKTLAQTLCDHVTWLQALRTHLRLGAEVVSVKTGSELDDCRERAAALSQQEDQLARPLLGLQACRRALEAHDAEAGAGEMSVISEELVEELITDFDQCSGMRVTEANQVKDAVATAALCLKAAADPVRGAKAAQAVLSVVDTSSGGASEPAGASGDVVSPPTARQVQLRSDAAVRGSDLASAAAEAETILGSKALVPALLQGISKLKASLSAFGDARAALERGGASEPAAVEIRSWAKWLAAAESAEQVLVRLAATVAEQKALPVQKATGELMAGGRSEELGGSWKAVLGNDAPWSDIVREMESCFWSKADAVATLEKGCSALQSALEGYQDVCSEVGYPPDEKITRPAEAKVKKALVTLTEEYMVSKCCNPDAKTASKLNKRLLDITHKFDYSEVHPTIRAEVNRLTA
ncbi:MAG: hypothetical protein GY772_22565 [bacterium]|nr:hypothetical protein [bacterium]